MMTSATLTGTTAGRFVQTVSLLLLLSLIRKMDVCPEWQRKLGNIGKLQGQVVKVKVQYILSNCLNQSY